MDLQKGDVSSMEKPYKESEKKKKRQKIFLPLYQSEVVSPQPEIFWLYPLFIQYHVEINKII